MKNSFHESSQAGSSAVHLEASAYSRRIAGSVTLAITAKVAELKRKGIEVISLGAGEPDFPTPDEICDAAIQAVRKGYTKYTPNAGIYELRESIARYLNRLGGDYTPEEILVSNGAKQSIVNALFAALDPGQEVLLPVPYWTSYPEQIKMAGGIPVFLNTSDDRHYKLDPDQLRSAITPKSRLLILNSPSNPTGSVYSRDELEELVRICKEHQLLILSDEIYLELIYDSLETCSLAAFADIRPQLLLVNGFSKSHAMTGWRVGYLAAKTPFIEAAKKIQSHTTSNASSISQYAALAAYQMAPQALEPMWEKFKERRDFVVSRLQDMPGVQTFRPQGAFYVFPNMGTFIGTRHNGIEITNSVDLANFLLEEAKVAVVPGDAFGAPQNIRISYATSMENLEKAMNQIESALNKLE